MKYAAILYVALLSLTGCYVLAQSNTPCTSGSVSAPSIPVNASCTYVASTTVGATAQTNAANAGTPSCGSIGPDVWYSFTAPASGNVTITTQAGGITDGVMALYSGSCGSWTQLACSDDANGLMPAITQTGLTPGGTYLIRFWQYGGGTGTFSMCVTSLTISNPGNNTTCATPSPICSGSPIAFIANTGGTAASIVNPGNNYDCLSTSPNPSWYYLEIATGGNLVIDVAAGSDVDYAIWGPFVNLTSAQSSCNTYALPKDCSYSISAVEQAIVNGVTASQVYVLLVTNYANTVQTITINQAAANTATTNCAIVPLPVGYIQWDVQYIDEQVVLAWGTDIEKDNKQFVIQRSNNGLIWETIGAVSGKGNTTEATYYHYTDHQPLTGISYYRLMQIDFNGTPSYTSILSVNTLKTETIAIYPNPAKNNFNVLTKNHAIDQLIISNPIGKSFPVTYTETEGGFNVDCSKLSAGIYTLTVISEGTIQSERLVIRE